MNEAATIAQDHLLEQVEDIDASRIESVWLSEIDGRAIYTVEVTGIARHWVLAGPLSWVDSRQEQCFRVQVDAEDGEILNWWSEEVVDLVLSQKYTQ